MGFSSEIKEDFESGLLGSVRTLSPPVGGRRLKAAERVFDIAIASIAMIIAGPLLLIVGATVFLIDGGPVFFTQNRIGHGGRLFRCLKFRSMVVDAEVRLAALLERDSAAQAEWARDHKLRIDPRITTIGAFLRRTSLDELPQFFNVIKGEMSIVGPRPIVASEAYRYRHRLALYWSVPPGITGLWQVSGRNDVSYRRRVAMDCVYARRKTVGLDFLIVLRTLPAVLLSKGSY